MALILYSTPQSNKNPSLFTLLSVQPIITTTSKTSLELLLYLTKWPVKWFLKMLISPWQVGSLHMCIMKCLNNSTVWPHAFSSTQPIMSSITLMSFIKLSNQTESGSIMGRYFSTIDKTINKSQSKWVGKYSKNILSKNSPFCKNQCMKQHMIMTKSHKWESTSTV